MKNILVVDDSSFARRTLRQILQEAGYTVEEAKDGPEALEKYFLKRPDLVLLDIVMEGMDGLDVLRKLNELDPAAEVVMATADVQTATQAEAKSLGAAGYIRKPYNSGEVLETVSKVLAGGVK
ncbi:MAG TPA: response regulator [Clostridia bacterium]|nr:response regulator [Clostridia bacterium]